MAISRIVRNGTPHLASLGRALGMLETVLADAGRSSIAGLAQATGVPVATAHRHVKTLVAHGYLQPIENGRHVAGGKLLTLLHGIDERQVITSIAAPVLRRLAVRVRSVVQLGTLDNEMVTYRIKTGRGAGGLFTRVGMQLEAYCSAIGKVLLAHLPERECGAYLASGPFVALTPNTIVDPAPLAAELDEVRQQGFALDRGEVAKGLRCVAVPIHGARGAVTAALSVSQAEASAGRIADDALVLLLRQAAREIEQRLLA